MLMLCAFPESQESPNRPIGLFGVLGVVPKEGSIAHTSMSGFDTLILKEDLTPFNEELLS